MERTNVDDIIILRYATRLQQEIIKGLLATDESGRLHGVLRHMAALLGAQAAYLIFFDKTALLSVDFFAESSDMEFHMPLGVAVGNIPLKMQYIAEAGETFTGGVQFSNALRLPVILQQEPIGLIELVNIGVAAKSRRVRQVMAIHGFLHSSLCLVYEHLLATRQNRVVQRYLDETRRMYDSLMNTTHDIIVSVTPDALIQSVNTVGRDVLGIVENTANNRLEMISPEWDFVLRQLETGHVLNDLEVVLTTGANRQVFCLASFSIEWGSRNDIQHIHIILKDITDRIQAQRELWQANFELTIANEQLKRNHQQMVQQEKLASIGQLAAGVAHEINNPLGFVRSNHDSTRQYAERLLKYVQLLEEKCGVGDSLRSQAKVDRIKQDFPLLLDESDEGFSRIIKIVKSLKDFSRIDSQGQLAVADLNKAIADTLTIARNSWRDVAVITSNFGNLPPVECYPDELNQVFLNIIVNSAQAIASQPRQQPGSITITTWAEQDLVYLQFDDNGPGIPMSIRNRLFEPFFTTKPVGQGTGLGLSVAYDIVVGRHHGQILLDDAPGGGARITLVLPLLQEKGASDVEANG